MAENRIPVQVRLRPDALALIDEMAEAMGVPRSEALRMTLAAGLPEMAKAVGMARPRRVAL